MEKAGKEVGCSSSSFTTDLFGPKLESSGSSPSSSLFGSIFGPPAKVAGGRDASASNSSLAYGNAKYEPTDSMTQKNNVSKEDRNPSCEPYYYNSSIYYGGQDVYSPTNQNINPKQVFKKDGGDVDPNESNSNYASRGNWWKGSLYY